jgi:ParB-like chromosome segregation protein Spo0J
LNDCARGRIPVEYAPVAALTEGEHPPRSGGADPDHVQLLSERIAELPPIVVKRSTRRVLDGVHRLRATLLAGHDVIKVYFFEGDEPNAYVLSVMANVRHGRPLLRAERTAAAERIMGLHPQWSDRAIAAAGLAPNTVGAIRRRSSAQSERLAVRRGIDGRIRPLDRAPGRRRTGRLLNENPDASLREIARQAGLSPGTVRDVRERLRRGEDILPPRLRVRPPSTPAADPSTGSGSVHTSAVILERMKRDPSLRFSEAGRLLLRLLSMNAVGQEERQKLVETVPAHCAGMAVGLARTYAQTWHDFAEQLERRAFGTRDGVTPLRGGPVGPCPDGAVVRASDVATLGTPSAR